MKQKPPYIKFTVLLLLFLTLLHPSSSQQIDCTITTDSQGIETSDCPRLHSCINNICVHKDIFPLTSHEIIGSLLIMLLAGLTNSGGLGGGSLLSPILLIFFKYDTIKTISIVYILIFGGSLGNFLNVFRQRDPTTKKPLVIYDLALLVMPLMIIGNHLGILVNQILAPVVTIICLTIVLYNMLTKIYARAKATHRNETRRKSLPLLSLKSEEKKFSSFSDNSIEMVQLEHGLPTMTQTYIDERVEDLLEEDYKFFPKRKLSLLALLITFTTIMAYLRGTDELDSAIGLDHCSFGYWGFFALTLVGCFGFYLNNKRFVLERLDVKKEAHIHFGPANYSLDNKEDMKDLGIFGAGAGFLAGLLGIGGGIILGPTLLKMGVEAQSLAATVGFFVVQTSFLSLFQSFLYGDFSMKELGYFFIISVIGSYVISLIVTRIINKYQRPSILLFLLSGVLLASMIAMPVFTVWKTYQHPEEMFSFRSLC